MYMESVARWSGCCCKSQVKVAPQPWQVCVPVCVWVCECVCACSCVRMGWNYGSIIWLPGRAYFVLIALGEAIKSNALNYAHKGGQWSMGDSRTVWDSVEQWDSERGSGMGLRTWHKRQGIQRGMRKLLWKEYAFNKCFLLKQQQINDIWGE